MFTRPDHLLHAKSIQNTHLQTIKKNTMPPLPWFSANIIITLKLIPLVYTSHILLIVWQTRRTWNISLTTISLSPFHYTGFPTRSPICTVVSKYKDLLSTHEHARRGPLLKYWYVPRFNSVALMISLCGNEGRTVPQALIPWCLYRR